MAERSFHALDEEHLKQLAEYEPGYEWMPDRFGPPPGIPRARKIALGV